MGRSLVVEVLGNCAMIASLDSYRGLSTESTLAQKRSHLSCIDLNRIMKPKWIFT